MPEANRDRQPRERVNVGGAQVKVEREEVRSVTGGGWKASEVLRQDSLTPDGDMPENGVSVVDAVREDRAARGALTPRYKDGTNLTDLGHPFAMYRHPSEFTEEEDEVIINGLLANLPLYMIAAKLNCSRQLVSKHIKESKLLSEAYADAQESFIDNVEWQAKRLIDSGNAAMIMFALQTKGKDRGWGQEPVRDEDLEDSRIIIGEIPAEEVDAANAKVKELEAEAGVGTGSEGGASPAEGDGSVPVQPAPTQTPTPTVAPRPQQKLPSPMDLAMMDEAAKEAARAVRDENTVSIPPEDVRVEPAPWDDGYGGGDPFDGGGFGGFM